MSALSLMAAHEHKHVKISPDDVVVISAHAIPGNESNVSRVIDSLHRAGAEVVHDRTSPVHVSGHASQEELKFLLNLLVARVVRAGARRVPPPRAPRAAGADEVGVAADRVLICEDGDVDHAHAPTAPYGERRAVPAGYMYVDGIVGDIGHGVLRDRKALSEEGVVVVIVTVDTQAGEVVTGPEIVTRGWVYGPEAEDLIEDAKQAVARGDRRRRSPRARTTSTRCAATPARSLGKFIDERTRRRPIVIPVVMEV